MNTTKTIPNLGHIQQGMSWIGGPTHTLQRQHIPGYGGHVSTLASENVHGKGFSRVSAQCLNGRTSIGFKPEPVIKYVNSAINFQKPNIRKTNFSSTAERLLNDLERREININQISRQQFRKQPKSIEEVKPIDRIPVVGYQGHRAVFRHPFRTVRPPSQPKPVYLRQIDEVKTMLQTGNFDTKKLNNISVRQVPVVGYSGYLKSVKAQNMFGQTYKDLAHRSIYS